MAGLAAGDLAPQHTLRRALLSALVIGLLLAPLAWMPGWQLVEGRLFDLLSTASPLRPATPGAVIVAIDEPSFAQLKRQWPWPRALHGQLIDTLRKAGAVVIAFDVIFSEPAGDADDDRRMAAALAPDVLLAGEETVIETPQAVQMLTVEPLPEFLARGARTGIASVTLDGDQVLRRLPAKPGSFARVLADLSSDADTDVPPGALIQYFGPARSYPTVSYYQALDPAAHLPPGYFSDKVVIVGLSLQNTASANERKSDTFATSFTASTGQLMAGPEVQATIFDNIVHRLYIQPVAPWIAALVAAAATLLAVLAAHGAYPWRAAVAVPAAILVIVGGSYLALRLGRIWLPPGLACVGAGLAVAADLAQGYLGEHLARRRITEAFGHYLAPSLVERLARDPSQLKLGGERRQLTVLFCDIRGFTAIAERLKDDPERLTHLINRVLTSLSEAVLKTGGTIDKYIGDCLMAFWNAPLDDPEHALHAVEAAIAMQRAGKRLNDELRAEDISAARMPVTLAVGIGINTGECVVGNLGSERRFDYTAVGDAVNLAARLEALCKTYDVGILLGAPTVERLASRIATRKLDTVAVSGRSEPVDIYTLG